MAGPQPGTEGRAPTATSALVLAVVDSIPAGTVMTYGEVAAAAGVGSARQVGRILARSGDGHPWHRVVMADGTVAPGLSEEQIGLLKAEGTALSTDRARVDLARAR